LLALGRFTLREFAFVIETMLDADKCGFFHCDCDVSSTASESEASWKWGLGLLFAIIAATTEAIGLVLQKLGQNQAKGEPEFLGLKYTNCTWVTGFLIMVLLPLPANMAAIALAPQSIVEPFSALTVVLCQVSAPCMLHERLSRTDIVATALIVVGCVVSALVGDHCDTEYTTSELKALFQNPAAYIVFAVLMTVLVISFFLLFCWLPRVESYTEGQRTMGAAVLRTVIAGTLCGQQSVLFKILGETFEQTFDGNNEGWKDWLVYAAGISGTLIAIFQIAQLNLALQLVDGVKALPMYEAVLIINTTVYGLVFYQEYDRMTDAAIITSVSAWLVIIFGVLLLALQDGTDVTPNTPEGDVRLGKMSIQADDDDHIPLIKEDERTTNANFI